MDAHIVEVNRLVLGEKGIERFRTQRVWMFFVGREYHEVSHINYSYAKIRTFFLKKRRGCNHFHRDFNPNADKDAVVQAFKRPYKG